MQAFLDYLMLLIPGLLGIGLILLIHELGHYLAARILKIDVETLSFGIGPKVFSIKGKNSEFTFSAIPFGGYCKMKGSAELSKAILDGNEKMGAIEKGSYFSTKPISRFLIYLAGPLTNFLLAMLLIMITSSIPVERLSDPAFVTPTSEYKGIFNSSILQPELRKGDLILSSGDREFKDYQDFEAFLLQNEGKVHEVKVSRDGEFVDIFLYPHKTDGGYLYGITLLQEPIVGRSIIPEIAEGDRVVKANGHPIDSTLDLYLLDSSNLMLTIERDGEQFDYLAINGELPFAWHSDLRKYSAGISITEAFHETLNMLKTTLKALGALFSFDLDGVKNVITGPMKAASTFGEISTLAFTTSFNSGIRSTLYLLSIVSISICVGNLLPIPTFDGGQMVITMGEMLKKDLLKPRTYLILQITGMAISYLILVSMYLMDILNIM